MLQLRVKLSSSFQVVSSSREVMNESAVVVVQSKLTVDFEFSAYHIIPSAPVE